LIKPSTTTLRIVVAVLFATTLFATGKGNTFASKSQAKLPVLHLDYNTAITGWNTTLDPANTSFTNDADTEMLMHAGLVNIRPPAKTNGKARVALDLADKVTVSKNRKVYTFHIRNKARFSNGHQVTAQDAIFSITRAAAKDVDPQEAATYDPLIKGLLAYNAGTATKISGLKAINSKTLQVTITKPAAYFMASFAYTSNFVLDRKVMAGHKVGDMTRTCTLNVGAGPFKPVCQNSSSDVTSFYKGGSTPSLTLVPNKYYYGPKPKISIVLPVINNPETAYNLYKAGQMDASPITPVSEIPQWKGKKDYVHWGTSIIRYVQMDTSSAPFSNIHCRLAVAHAIDRNTIATKVVPGVYTNLYTFLPPGFLGSYNGKATANKKGGTPWYSPALAKKELAQCPGGINIEWPYRVTTADSRRVRDALGSMLEQAGIHVKFRDITSQEHSREQVTPMSDTGVKIVRSGWQQDYPDPQDYVSLLIRHGQTYAITGWNNKTFNKLVDKADVEPNRSKRAQMYITAQKLAISNAVVVPEWNDIGQELVKPYVHGLVATSAYAYLKAANNDWSKVTVGKH